MSTRRLSRRSLVPAAIALLAALLLGGHGTYAYWSDQGSVQSAPLTAGTIDITLDGNLKGTAGSGGTWQNSAFTLDAMLPGESRAISFAVQNAGTAPLTYAVDGLGTGTLLTALRFSVYVGATANNSGTAVSGNRTGTCTGGTALAQRVTLTTTSSSVTTRRPLAPAGSETMCLVFELDSAAGNELQGTTAGATLRFDARQPLP